MRKDMKLTYEQIKKIVKGTASTVEEDGKVCFHRFTDEQLDMYREVSDDFYVKAFSTAGVRLEFVTDSKALAFEAAVSKGSSRSYFNHDIYVNGEHLYTLGDDLDGVPGGSVAVRGEYELGEGEKTVKIYLPWSATSKLVSLELDDGATLMPVEHSLKMLCFGDSITHGYDAANPSASYSSILTDALDAESINKAIGGEVFRSELGAMRDGMTPDVITVAYGTNDWRGRAREDFLRECEGFYKNLSALYPNAKIFAMTPIWRGNCKIITRVGAFERVKEKLIEVANALPNVTVIDCTDFVPHEAKLYSYDVLHPNSYGFSFYADGVISAIRKSM